MTPKFTISPGDYSPIQTLSRYIEQINDWMCQNLQLNKDKSEILVFGTTEGRVQVSAQLESVTMKCTNQRLAQTLTSFKSKLKTFLFDTAFPF